MKHSLIPSMLQDHMAFLESEEQCAKRLGLVSGEPEDIRVALAGYVCQDRKGKLILLVA